MKMKLRQRIAIGYFKTKLKTIALISEHKAAESAFKLFCTPFNGKNRQKAPAVFHKGDRISFNLEGLQINGWKWKPGHSNGKKVLIVHGFDSRSYKFEKYILLLTSQNFEVLAFDAPAHGISQGKTINALLYRDMIWKAAELYGPFYSIISHSLGGIAASLAAEKMDALQKLVLIAPATETKRAVNNFLKLIRLNSSFKKELESVMEDIAGLPLSYFSVSRAIRNIHAKTLWLHDTGDRICPYEDVIPVQKMELPDVDFYITSGLGHSKIYKDHKVMHKIISFVTPA
jgi:pimeloyl-ACP methyl ester carboxylesterase